MENTLINSASSLKTTPNFRLNRSMSIPIFRQKWCNNHALWGDTYQYDLYKEVPQQAI